MGKRKLLLYIQSFERRSHEEMQSKNKLITILLISVLSFTACQPTPDLQPVVNKGDGELTELIQSSPSSTETNYEVPETINESFPIKDGSSNVIVDATIEVPDVSAFSVRKVVPDDITQERADQIINALLPGKTLYFPRELQDYSKAEILDMMAKLKEGKDSDLNAVDPKKYQEFIAPQIEELQQALLTAPDQSKKRISDGKFIAEKTNSGKNLFVIDIEADLGKSKYASLKIGKKDIKSIFIDFSNVDQSYFYPTGKVMEKLDHLTSLNISVDEAKKTADEYIQKLDLSNLKVAAIGSLPSGKNASNIPETVTYDDLPKCYVFYYTRNVNGVITTYVSGNNPLDVEQSQKAQYIQSWPNELAEVYVDDTGVIGLTYESPTQMGEVMNENVSLKPFSEIMQRFDEQMKIGGAWIIDDQIISRTVHINKITLGMARIANKDNPNEYLMVPVWDFFGYCVQKYPDTYEDSNLDANHEIIEDYFGHSYLTINAIDGSVIDRSLGY